jgi:hypothetical protein
MNARRGPYPREKVDILLKQKSEPIFNVRIIFVTNFLLLCSFRVMHQCPPVSVVFTSTLPEACVSYFYFSYSFSF